MSLIRCDKLCKSFAGTPVLKDVDLCVQGGEIVVLTGRSGSGKSTLLRCLNALDVPDSGTLEIAGHKLGRGQRSRQALRRETGMVFQQFKLFPQMTARDNVMLGPRKVLGLSRKESQAVADRLLRRVGLETESGKLPAELSGGQQQRVAIARALAVNPRIMLFDEPTSALDPELRGEVLRVMQDLAEDGMTMLVVTHELRFAEKVGTRLLFLDQGRILHDGEPSRLLREPPSERLRSFIGSIYSD